MSGGRGRGLPRFWLGDEELAKKDDDLNAPGHSHGRSHALSLSRRAQNAPAGAWQAATGARAPRRTLIMRLASYVVLILLVLLGLNRIFGITSPAASLHLQTSHQTTGSESTSDQHPSQPPKTPPPGFNQELRSKALEAPRRIYNEPLQFPFLADTLRALPVLDGDLPASKNVLFMAGSLRSATSLLPFACRMAQRKQQSVHFAFVLNSDIEIQEVLKLNGITKKCPIIVHDGRPDQPYISTDLRMARASARALYHIGTFVMPLAVLIDGTAAEEYWFLAGVRDQVRSLGMSLIELPERPSARLGWVTSLDSSSLAEWNGVKIDILVRAPSGGSESMIRLLSSLSRADLSSIPTPHLTIELPSTMDKPLDDFISKFSWPPSSRSSSQPSSLSLRKRIPRSKLTPEESSIRFLESFWPNDPRRNHVLVLSPNTEVAPHFFQYVKYMILSYKYDSEMVADGAAQNLLGFAFGRPKTLLDAKTQFIAPAASSASGSTEAGTPFRWSAPNSDAMLIMGDKWQELHNYVTLLSEKLGKAGTSALLEAKEVSDNYPAWLKHVSQLSRLRGYFTLYPNSETSDAILGVHKELYRIPEEYQPDPSDSPAKGDAADVRSTQYRDTFDPSAGLDLLTLLPDDGKLKPLKEMPLLSFDSKKVGQSELESAAGTYAKQFRQEVGGCNGDDLDRGPEQSAADLFCKTSESTGSERPKI